MCLAAPENPYGDLLCRSNLFQRVRKIFSRPDWFGADGKETIAGFEPVRAIFKLGRVEAGIVHGLEFENRPLEKPLVVNGLVGFRVEGKRQKTELVFDEAVEVDLRSRRRTPHCNREGLIFCRFPDKRRCRYQLVSLAQALAPPVGINLLRGFFDLIE